MTLVTPAPAASEVAERAADRAGVEILELATADATTRGAELLQEVWGGTEPVLPHNLLRAVQCSGGYVFGAYADAGALLAVSVGLLAAEGLHSHITGVTPAGQRRGLGFAMKQHQRAWALERGMPAITWTCDPLVRRNVAFNLHALGASVVRFLPNHYGSMLDAVNHGDESDRIEVRWDLRALAAESATAGRLPWVCSEAPTAVEEGAHGGPVLRQVGDGPRRVQLPADVEALRRADPAAARDWRIAVREAVLGGLGQGLEVTGVTAGGALVLEVRA